MSEPIILIDPIDGRMVPIPMVEVAIMIEEIEQRYGGKLPRVINIPIGRMGILEELIRKGVWEGMITGDYLCWVYWLLKQHRLLEAERVRVRPKRLACRLAGKGVAAAPIASGTRCVQCALVSVVGIHGWVVTLCSIGVLQLVRPTD